MIELPQLSQDAQRYVKLPKPPSNPPTFDDIANAMHFTDILVNEHDKGNISAEDVVKGVVYNEKLIATQRADASDDVNEPPWFAPAMARVLQGLGIMTSLQNFQNNTQAIINRTEEPNEVQVQTRHVRDGVLISNEQCGAEPGTDVDI